MGFWRNFLLVWPADCPNKSRRKSSMRINSTRLLCTKVSWAHKQWRQNRRGGGGEALCDPLPAERYSRTALRRSVICCIEHSVFFSPNRPSGDSYLFTGGEPAGLTSKTSPSPTSIWATFCLRMVHYRKGNSSNCTYASLLWVACSVYCC